MALLFKDSIVLQKITICHIRSTTKNKMASKEWVSKSDTLILLKQAEATLIARSQGFNKANIATFKIKL